MSEIVFECFNISFDYPNKKVLKDVSFSLAKGEIGVLLGPSGCGKTTMLRLIAELEKTQKGSINIKQSNQQNQSKVGFVFQDYALFPHMTVKQNIEFPISFLPKPERENISANLIYTFNLTQEQNKYPHQISGGQQQRTAIARSLSLAPELLLMDEPFSNLDFSLRQILINELKLIFKKLSITCIFVTHDLTEAFSFADKMGVIHEGKLLQWGSIKDLTEKPKNKLVTEILQTGNLIPCVQKDNQFETCCGNVLKTNIQNAKNEVSASGNLFLPHGKIAIDSNGHVKGKIISVQNTGKVLCLVVEIDEKIKINLYCPINFTLALNSMINLHFDWQSAVFLN